MRREEILVKAAGKLREDAEALASSHTLSGGAWGSDPEDQRAQADHDERIELADLLIAMAKGAQ